MVPLELAAKGVVITQYDLVAVARLGLIKIDLLGNRCLSELDEVLSQGAPPPHQHLQQIPLDDQRTLALIDRADTLGCFQLESPVMRSLLARLPIGRLSDLIAALALIRPGAAAGEVKAAFIRRARGEEQSRMNFPNMADRLQQTHGLFLYEEDIMILLSRAGGISLEEADELRSAIVSSGGDPAILSILEENFVLAAKRRGVNDREILSRAWQTASRLAAYSFNKAHAASYGLLAYFSAYAKVHFPLEFGCALLNHHQGLYPLRTLAAELVRMGIMLQGPHVNYSIQQSTCERKGAGGIVKVGLNRIKSLSRRTMAKILEERASKGNFTSLCDLLQRIRPGRGELSALVLSGACDGLSPLAANLYPFAQEAALDWLQGGGDPAGLDALPIPRPVEAAEDRVRLYQTLVRVKNELRYLEMHLVAHPLALLRKEADRYGCVTVGKAARLKAGKRLTLAVMVAAMRRIAARQGIIQFLSLEDESGLMEAVLLPPVYRSLGNQVTTPGPFLVEGKLKRQQGAVHLEVSAIAPFHQRKMPFASS